MKDCARHAPLIGSREGELAPDEAAALQAHLDSCAACRARAADLAATDGLVAEALMARANERDFGPFVDGVMERLEREGAFAKKPAASHGRAPRERPSFLAWLTGHRRFAVATLAPVLAGLAILMYVRQDGRGEIAALELSAEGEVTMVLQTSDGPVVLLGEERS
jgi:anti-sigma factor RsiW